MATIRRLFGIADDATTGGSEYDDLSAIAAGVAVAAFEPIDATFFIPVTGGSLDWNLERIDRNEEVRMRRAVMPPLPFRAAPTITVPGLAYRSVVEKLLRKALGNATYTPTGTGPYTHSFPLAGMGGGLLPIHSQMVRDDLNQKMSGGFINRLTLNFPLDGEGTWEAEIHGLYAAHYTRAMPTVAWTGLSADVMMLRDAKVFIDGSATAIPDLQGFEFTYNNNLEPKFYASKNVVTQSIGSPALTRKLWFPGERKFGAAADVTYALNFGNVDTAQELALQYGRIQKFVFEVTGGPITGGTELLRITIYAGEHTGGGTEALSARDDITARFEGTAGYSESDAADIKVEVVSSTATAIT